MTTYKMNRLAKRRRRGKMIGNWLSTISTVFIGAGIVYIIGAAGASDMGIAFMDSIKAGLLIIGSGCGIRCIGWLSEVMG